MKQIRLLPIVVLATSALLVLKTIGIVTGAGYTLGGVGVAVAQTSDIPAEGEVSDAAVAAADAAAEALFSSPSSPAPGDEVAPVLERSGSGIEELDLGTGDTEEMILQRLAERRAELDAFAAELETRLAVVEAAELRIEERMAELAALEARINAAVDERDAAEAEQFAAIVAMYENMRPADAATIFNDLETGVLVRVGRAMNPRKLGPIMAKMLPVKAQELTVLLAQAGEAPAIEMADQDFAQLPQIVGQ